MDDSFLAALYPGNHRVLGRRLRAYCHGHVATLYALGSPFLAAAGTDARIGAGDLILALRVCQAPGYPLLDPAGLRPRLRDLLLRWWLERRPARLRAAAESFQRYQDAHCSFPEFYGEGRTSEDDDEESPLPDAPAGRSLSAPFLLARVLSLLSRSTLTWEQALQMPLALPSWCTGTLDELEGGTRFLYAGDEEEDDLPPDVSRMSEAEIYAQAVRDLGREKANEWRQARRNARRRAKRRQQKKGPPTHGA